MFHKLKPEKKKTLIYPSFIYLKKIWGNGYNEGKHGAFQ